MNNSAKTHRPTGPSAHRPNKTYTIYILKCSDNSLYTGITPDLTKRLEKHAAGKGSKYVRSRLPFELVYTEKKRTRSNALKRECALKKMSKAEKMKIIS